MMFVVQSRQNGSVKRYMNFMELFNDKIDIKSQKHT